MSPRAARFLVFTTAAAVLVLEILAGRLLAPYLGLSLEVFTGIIGTVLAGISMGAWAGGRAADRYDPHRFIGPLVAGGGVLALAAPPIVDALGPSMRAAGPGEILAVTGLAFFAPAGVLSAVTPMVVKIRLRDLAETGTIVGSYSAVGTAGAIFGTFVTGFVLIAALPTRPIVFGVGGGLVAWGAALTVARFGKQALGIIAVPALAASGALAFVEGPCELETAYHCAYVTVDDTRPSGRTLWLDTLRHSYVDLDDPTHLEFRYTKVMADAVDALAPPGALDVLFVGGGGFTLPRFFPAVRPGSTSTVLEIDRELVSFAADVLGLDTANPALRVHTGDARLLIDDEPGRGFEVIVGDAFGGLAVPWHLTTEEFTELVASRLAPGGVYVLNVIDHPPSRFARAEAATLLEVFAHVAVAAPQLYLDLEAGGNYVMIASADPIDVEALAAAIARRGGAEEVITADALDAFVDGARSLTDDFAPVDQLLTAR
jgi:spermidine synthase